MELKIYGKDGNLKLTASPGSSSTLAEEVMGECSVSASFTHTAFVPLDVNDYTEVLGVKYKIRSPYRPAQKNTQTYQYQVKLYAPIHDAEDALMLYTADGDIRSEFSYDGGPREHLQLWADNMNRIAGGTLWTIGTVITGGNKTIGYNNMSCWDAAFGSSGIAAAFETEMWADGFVINLCKASRGETVELGYLQGLTRLSQEDNGDVKFFTRLFPLGSTRNIDASKYGHARLQLPSGAAYVDKNTELYGVKEAYEEAAFAGIYPKYTGTISSVRTEEKENEEGRKYTVYYFKDSGMAFNPMDYQIPDLTFMLAFQTGDLAGRGNVCIGRAAHRAFFGRGNAFDRRHSEKAGEELVVQLRERVGKAANHRGDVLQLALFPELGGALAAKRVGTGFPVDVFVIKNGCGSFLAFFTQHIDHPFCYRAGGRRYPFVLLYLLTVPIYKPILFGFSL